MGLLVASSVADALIRFDNGDQGADDADDQAGADASGDPADGHRGNVATQGDLLDAATHSAADPWLDGWRDDGFVSDDAHTREGDAGTGNGPEDSTGTAPDQTAKPSPDTQGDGAEPDPWLDGWRDDSFVSSDTAQEHAPDDSGVPDQEPPDGHAPGPDSDTDSPDPADSWLDGWRDSTHVSSDIPPDLAALAGGAQAVHVLAAGELFDTAGGTGAFVIGDWIGDGDPAIIRSFDPMADRLIFAYDAAIGAPQITVKAGSQGDPALLMIDAQPVLALEGLAQFDAASVVLYPIRLDG
ncbi:MAG: hypothetical protein JJU19_16395 [Pararhodobacter sp.]|nr:hypothetical protein [Pararhodobacter sp.]